MNSSGAECYKLKKNINKQQITFYLKSCKYLRFPFFDIHNCYRRDGLFSQLEECLHKVGEKMTKEYGANFVSINLRGSWLRGIPIQGDDVDVLFIISHLPESERIRIREYTRRTMIKENELFTMCEGKYEKGIKVEPIIFLDLADIEMIMNRYLYGLSRFLKKHTEENRDLYQDSFLGSKLTEKKAQFLKSGILIPYVGWLYGQNRKHEVFDEIKKTLPIPTKRTARNSAREIDEAKETIRQAFIARNLIYPSMEVKKWIDLRNSNVEAWKQEAIVLYRALKPLEEIFARAVINYIYTLEIESKFLGIAVTPERVQKFAPSYDSLVYDILETSSLRLALNE